MKSKAEDNITKRDLMVRQRADCTAPGASQAATGKVVSTVGPVGGHTVRPYTTAHSRKPPADVSTLPLTKYRQIERVEVWGHVNSLCLGAVLDTVPL